MKLLTPVQMNEVDKKAGSIYHIPSVILMEHAANSVFDYIMKEEDAARIVIVCGPGNNGGDGLALARLITSLSDKQVEVIMMASADKLSEDGKIYYDICSALNVLMVPFDEANEGTIKEKLQRADLIVDALFGTGLKRPIEGSLKKIVEAINERAARTISIDIPSGIDGVTGKVQGVCIKADVTITFMTPKVGLFLYPAICYTGEVKVVNIGIPKALIEESPGCIYSIEREEMKRLLPMRPIRSNKGTFGKVLTIGGQLGMAGAISLTSLAAYKVGCGTVTTMVPRCIIEIMQQKLTEVMAIGAADWMGHFHEQATGQLEEIIDRFDVIAIGPGMGRTSETRQMLETVLKSNKPCVIDADALFFVPQVKDLLVGRKAPVIMTPHPGEMARMMATTIEEVLDDPLKVLKEFVQTYGAIGVLKIEKTVIADRNLHIYINRYGNSGLAKGGSGDTLTGIITGLLAQHMAPLEATKLGVYLQTSAADLAQKALSTYSYLASDTISYLSNAFLDLSE